MESRRPRSSQTTVSVNFDESDCMSPNHPRIKFGVAECIETKTITTTTTTKRSYPPLLVRESKPLLSLDAKEFPLARKSTPPELANFSFVLNDDGFVDWPMTDSDEQTQQSISDEASHDTNLDSSLDGSFTESVVRPSSTKPRSQTHLSSRKPPKIPHGSSPPIRMFSDKKDALSRLSLRSQSSQLPPNSVGDNLRRGLSRFPHLDIGRDREHVPTSAAAPATPLMSDLSLGHIRPPLKLRRSNLDSFETPQSEASQQDSFFDISSPTGSDSHTAFSGTVATPPITDADVDAEPFADPDESLQQSIRALHHPRPINTVVDQDASLPSPRLSPTLQSAQLHTPDHEDGELGVEDESTGTLMDENPHTHDDELGHSATLQNGEPTAVTRYESTSHVNLMDSRLMLESFDAMPVEMKSALMYQLLRRCPRKTLHLVSGVVDPVVKLDILQFLPIELTLNVLSFLDHRDLCRAAQVSTHWRGIIDSNETGWKELFDRDGFKLALGEMERAIREGWGWQDPVGAHGCERDLSLQTRLTLPETELRATTTPKSELPLPKPRFAKRKRGLNGFTANRSKRRASNQDNVKDERTSSGTHKSEGPNSAANAAALAVPDPHIGIPRLRKLHLFKSLYRRHYMIKKSWTSGKVKPGHVAFVAHPRHVITCLQFDDDKIITGSDDMLIHVYETKTGKLRRKLEGHEGGVWALQYEGNTLVSGSTDRSVRVWDIEKGLCTQVFYGHTSTVRCLQILMPTKVGVEDGRDVMMPAKPLIITGSRDSQLRVWRLPEVGSKRYIQTGPPANDADCPYFIRTLQGHTHSVRAIAAHGDTLVSGSYDNTVRVWRISTGETVHVLQGHLQKVYSVVLDVERNRCISGSMDSFVKIWDLSTGSLLYTLEGHNLLVGLLDLRDQRLVSAAADSTLRIWDPESGRCQAALTAHTGAITCFQHDGQKVISGSDRTLKLWDTRSGECLQDLLTDLSGVWQVRFDERRCVAAVQRDQMTYVEILDFGAVRDGKKPEELGTRILLNPSEVQRVQRVIEEDG